MLCPRRCGINRRSGKRGYCGVGEKAVVAHYGPHFGEEPPITGTRGSGTIFFSSCNLRCIYCQNHQISHTVEGEELTVGALTDLFFYLGKTGVHNINLVSPTPYIPVIAAAIERARGRGFSLPFVYNTHAYETLEALRMLDGLIDIYLPDFKYWNGPVAEKLSHAADYPESARTSIGEMKRQVGDLKVENGIAQRGLLIRHLVLPNNLAGSRQVIDWIWSTLGPKIFVSLMSQYYPLHKASEVKLINRRIRGKEYEAIIGLLAERGFENVYVQDLESAHIFVPDFDRAQPFGERPATLPGTAGD
jgi:putative pyruvate formate lyase activating enzyme